MPFFTIIYSKCSIFTGAVKHTGSERGIYGTPKLVHPDLGPIGINSTLSTSFGHVLQGSGTSVWEEKLLFSSAMMTTSAENSVDFFV